MGVVDRELRIDRLAAGGRGVARCEGQVWFVAGGIPGDRVLARKLRGHSRFVEGRVVRLLEPSVDRRVAPCVLQRECGGCPWMAMDESLQRHWKVRLLEDALGRIGGIESPLIDEIRHAGPPLGYRNKVEFTLRPADGGRMTLGLHSADPQQGVLDVPACPVQHEEANELLSSVREWLERERPEFPAAATYRITIRRSWATGELLLGIGEGGHPFPAADLMADYLRQRHPGVVGVVRLIVPPGRRGGVRTRAVSGRDWIEERVGRFRFRLPAATFLQINPELGTELVSEVVRQSGVRQGSAGLDLYGGVGINGLELAVRGARIRVCDADRDAVRCGRETARRMHLRGIDFVHADVRRFLGERRGEKVDVVVANPPRAGLGRGVARAIGETGCRRLLMVSCDPASLARDLRSLIEAGFRLEKVIPFDLFPQTAHVEALAVLTRTSSAPGGPSSPSRGSDGPSNHPASTSPRPNDREKSGLPR